jgi:hypothetical protein
MNQTVAILGLDFIAWHKDNFQGSDAGGIYVLARLPPDPNGLTALFVSPCENFKAEVPAHPLWPAALALGATHILTLEVPVPATRALIAENMIKLLRPALNPSR